MLTEEDEGKKQPKDSHQLINVASMKNSVVDMPTSPSNEQRKYHSAQKDSSGRHASAISNGDQVIFDDNRGTPSIVMEDHPGVAAFRAGSVNNNLTET